MIYRSFDPFSPIPDTVLPELIAETKPKEQEAKNDLLSNTGNTLTAGGVIYSEFGNTIANKNFWIDAKGNYKSTDLLNKQANGKYVRGVQGYRNGYNSALKVAGKYQAAGKVVGGLGIGITVWEIGSGQKNLIGEGGLDLIMGSIGFTGWGAPISLIYLGENIFCKKLTMIFGINDVIMKWYIYLNFYIYSYYKKREQAPVISTLIITSLLLHLNIFSIYMIYMFVTDFWTIPKLHSNYIVIIVTFLLFLVIINYFLIYYKQKYMSFFNEFEKNIDMYKHWNLSAKSYIFLSIGLCLITLIIADLRNHNFELYFLK